MLQRNVILHIPDDKNAASWPNLVVAFLMKVPVEIKVNAACALYRVRSDSLTRAESCLKESCL